MEKRNLLRCGDLVAVVVVVVVITLHRQVSSLIFFSRRFFFFRWLSRKLFFDLFVQFYTRTNFLVLSEFTFSNAEMKKRRMWIFRRIMRHWRTNSGFDSSVFDLVSDLEPCWQPRFRKGPGSNPATTNFLSREPAILIFSG